MQAIYEWFAPLFTTFAVVTFGGAAVSAAISILVPAPFATIKRWAMFAAIGFVGAYVIGIHNYNLGSSDMKARWVEANRMAEIVAAEKDAENYNKTREEKERILAEIDRERKAFSTELEKLVQDRKKQPAHCRIDAATLERLRRLAGDAAARP